MINLVLTLVFSVVLLIFMIFPALKTTQWIAKKITLSVTMENFLTIWLTVLFSLAIGMFLRFG
jgi:uncharacterized protein YneF (UPF0154 family)